MALASGGAGVRWRGQRLRRHALNLDMPVGPHDLAPEDQLGLDAAVQFIGAQRRGELSGGG